MSSLKALASFVIATSLESGRSVVRSFNTESYSFFENIGLTNYKWI